MHGAGLLPHLQKCASCMVRPIRAVSPARVFTWTPKGCQMAQKGATTKGFKGTGLTRACHCVTGAWGLHELHCQQPLCPRWRSAAMPFNKRAQSLNAMNDAHRGTVPWLDPVIAAPFLELNYPQAHILCTHTAQGTPVSHASHGHIHLLPMIALLRVADLLQDASCQHHQHHQGQCVHCLPASSAPSRTMRAL